MVVFPSRKILMHGYEKLLSDYSEGDIVYIPENNVMTAFYVAKHNYESDLNGTGRTLLVRRDAHTKMDWNHRTTTTNSYSTYANSKIDKWLNGEYNGLLDKDIQQGISTTTFYYTIGKGNATITTLTRSIFLLSVTELGQTHNYANIEGTALNIANFLRFAPYGNSFVSQWTRSPYTQTSNMAFRLKTSGEVYSELCSDSEAYSRPVFTLPDTTKFYYDTDEFKEVS